MDFDEAEKFRKFMRGEAEQPFTDIETGQPRVVDEDPFERLLKSFEGRVNGGDVEKGVPYITGERGPELVVPDQSGTIVPNDE